MKLRQLLSASGLYGIADMLVVAVSGFLLLPLYTRALSQDQFGAYVIIRANAEIFGYVLYFGLVSTVGRLYFDHAKTGRARDYFNTIVMFFLFVTAVTSVLLLAVGDSIWTVLSPATSSEPYLWYTLVLVITGFFAQLGSLWLRLDSRVKAFVTLQILSAAVLTIAAWLGLVVYEFGLSGLLTALVIGYLPASFVLFAGIGSRLRPAIDRTMIVSSLQYGIPLAVSYVAYFVLNRFSVLTLQHHVSLQEIAIFGLAQQVALIIAVGAQSFGKAMQPAVFSASPDEAGEVLRRSSKLFIVLIFGLASLAVVIARELIVIVAPRSYLSGFNVMLILLVASFVYSLSLVSNTALDYHRRPRIQAGVSIFGAGMAAVFGLTLIPPYGLLGGALATSGAYLAMTIASHWAAYRLTGQSYFAEMAVVTIALCALALVAAWPGWAGILLPLAVLAKLGIAGATFALIVAIFAPQRLKDFQTRLRL